MKGCHPIWSRRSLSERAIRWRNVRTYAIVIPDRDRADGMRRLAAELDSGGWRRRWGQLLDLGEPDLGYRVLVARYRLARLVGGEVAQAVALQLAGVGPGQRRQEFHGTRVLVRRDPLLHEFL
jgi:hypothetical protein